MTDMNLHFPRSRDVVPVALQGNSRRSRRIPSDLRDPSDLRLDAPHAPVAAMRADVSLPQNPFYRVVGKRALDISLVVLLAPLALLLIGLASLALWLEGGNPFYHQDRLGRDGSRFRIFKLRTMVRDADKMLEEHLARDPDLRKEWDATQKLKNDPRITPIGAILRKTSLDELPQLWNVFTGEMSLIGPRPMLPEQLALYGDAGAYFALRPGITGPWQVSARNEDLFTERAVFDRDYDVDLCLGHDFMILFKTVGVVLRRTGY